MDRAEVVGALGDPGVGVRDAGRVVEVVAGVPVVPGAIIHLDEYPAPVPVVLEARPVVEDQRGARVGREGVRRRYQIGIEVAVVDTTEVDTHGIGEGRLAGGGPCGRGDLAV